jgi:site-specific recombinase XerD
MTLDTKQQAGFFEEGRNVMEVASITGHKDLRMLQRYTHLRAEDLALKLG